MNKENSRSAVNRLTVLWALSESGLGGVMHALKIPFTGFFVGGFAVICIGLIAFYSSLSSKRILQSTILVILVKFTVSPQSPLPAYFAVAFQGVFGAFIYSHLSNFKLASLLFGMIALIESAIQKIITLTLLFGRSLWEALDVFLKDLNLFSTTVFSYSYWLVTLYASVYAFWGLLLGLWISRLPLQIQARSVVIGDQLRSANQMENNALNQSPQKKLILRPLFFFLLFLFIIGVFLAGDFGSAKIAYVIVRTFAALILIFYVIFPLAKWLLQVAAKNSTAKHKEAVDSIVKQLPQMQQLIAPSWKIASENYSGLRKYKEFVFILIVAALNFEKIEE